MLTVTNSSGITFNVRVVHIGEHYGLNDCLTHGDPKLGRSQSPLIEFYDARLTNCGPRGQFVSRYYASTLLETGSYPNGLCLDGLNAHCWTVEPKPMTTVMTWLREVLPQA